MRNDFQMREQFSKGTSLLEIKRTLDLQSLEQV